MKLRYPRLARFVRNFQIAGDFLCSLLQFRCQYKSHRAEGVCSAAACVYLLWVATDAFDNSRYGSLNRVGSPRSAQSERQQPNAAKHISIEISGSLERASEDDQEMRSRFSDHANRKNRCCRVLKFVDLNELHAVRFSLCWCRILPQ